MKLVDFLKIALIGLKTNKIRSFLTMLGIIIGIASVILMLSLGTGAHNLIIGQIVSLGSNNIFIEPGAWSGKMEKGTMMQSILEEFDIKTLTLADAEAIGREPTVEMVAPFVSGVGRMVYKNTSKKITFMGTTEAAAKITDSEIILGRAIKETDVKSMARVIVLGYDVAEDLFGQENPLGKTVRIKKTNFKVIGVRERQGTQVFMNLDGYVYVPITTAQKLLLGVNHIRQIIVKAKSADVIDEAIYNIRLLLRERHNIYNPEGDPSKDDFKIMSQEETAEMLGTVTSILTVLLSSIAAIALIVGGIGIMNIMLVSVTERTREVGLRKAVGARKKDILCQFLVEAIVLTVFGGIIGIILGVIFSYLSSIIISATIGLKWGFVVPLNAVAVAFGVSSIIGLVFGIYPAHKAAELSPIAALRYE